MGGKKNHEKSIKSVIAVCESKIFLLPLLLIESHFFRQRLKALLFECTRQIVKKKKRKHYVV